MLDYNVPKGKLVRGMTVFEVVAAIRGDKVRCVLLRGIARCDVLGGLQSGHQAGQRPRMVHRMGRTSGFVKQMTEHADV